VPRRSYDRSRLVSPDAHLLREGADVGNPNEDLNPIRLYPNAEAAFKIYAVCAEMCDVCEGGGAH